MTTQARPLACPTHPLLALLPQSDQAFFHCNILHISVVFGSCCLDYLTPNTHRSDNSGCT